MLSPRTIDSEIRKATKEKILNDGAGGKGNGSLRLRIRPGKSGVTACWIGSWTANGKLQNKQLGKYPGMTLNDARERFQEEVRVILHQGKNPKAATAKTDTPTVQKLFEGYVASMKVNDRSSWLDVEQALLTGKYAAVKQIGADRLACDIEPGDVANYLKAAYDRGSRTVADRCRSYILAAYNWGIKATHDYTAANRQDWGIKFNPASLIKKDSDASTARERNLSAAEIKQLWLALDGQGFSAGTSAAIRLLIACGQRVRETLRIEGREIDLNGKVWNMPAAKSKIGKPHVIPLPDLAVDVFARLKAQHGDGHLFPGMNGSDKLLSDVALARSISRWCAKQGVERFQPRDLRRTWKSRSGEVGIDRFTRDLIQQHARSGDTGSRHYDMTDYLPQMREAMNKWSKWLENAVS